VADVAAGSSARGRGATRVLQGIALALGASMLVTALHDISTTWDVWYYHMPFAARIWGIVPPEAFAFHALDQARYDGYPLLAEVFQGLLWRVTGRPEASNLVALASLTLFVWFLKHRFQVPLHLSVVALMAIPLVQLHATSCYIDLPANVCMAVLLLTVYDLRVEEAAPPRPAQDRTLFLLGVATAGAANMRFQLHLPILLALLAAAPKVLGPLFADLRGPFRSRALRRLAIVALALPLVFFSPLKNAIVHHNPYYPMKLDVAGLSLPGVESVYSSSPPYLAHAPGPVRWAYSVLEIGIRPMTERRRWTLDQWMPSDGAGNRMGGFFGAYAVFHLALLGWITARDRSREAKAAAVFFAAVTAVSSLLPQSHELRYYLYWMIVLVSLNLILACRLAAAPARGLSPPALGAACAAALAVVLAVTRCGYVYPSGSSFETFLGEKVDAATLGQIHVGDRVCLAKDPWTILYAAPFHRPADYAVKESAQPGDCGAYRRIE
jgi:hypothetical protein